MSAIASAQKESAELLKKATLKTSSIQTPQAGAGAGGAQSGGFGNSDVFLTSMSTLSKDLTTSLFDVSKDFSKSIVDAYTEVGVHHKKLTADMEKQNEELKKENAAMVAELKKALTDAAANKAKAEGLETTLAEVRAAKQMLFDLTEALRAEKNTMVEKIMNSYTKSVRAARGE